MKKVKNWLGEYMEFEGSIGEAIANHRIGRCGARGFGFSLSQDRDSGFEKIA